MNDVVERLKYQGEPLTPGVAVMAIREIERLEATSKVASLEVKRLEAEAEELRRLNLEAREEWAKTMEIIGDIEQIRTVEGNSVTIICDNPEADSGDMQAAVDVSGDFTAWNKERYWGESWTEALRKAADASRRFNARD